MTIKSFRRWRRPGWNRAKGGAEVVSLKRRLKGLDEFETPEFVGRMARVERRRRVIWYAMLAGAVAVGSTIGWMAF